MSTQTDRALRAAGIKPSPATCASCGDDVDKLALFPGGICLDCYKQTPDARRPLTAGDIVSMWSGKR